MLNVQVDLEGFVTAHLPPPDGTVLEIGCGTGELARALAERGYDVTAVDPEAPLGAIFRRTSFEDFTAPGPFDAVVASRSLHHIPELGAALEKVARLLVPRGVLVLNEFAWERTDERTAQWYMSHVPDDDPDHESLHPEKFPDQWMAEHHDLHDSTALRRALDLHFEQRFFEWVPYMTDNYLKRPDLVAEEKRMIDSGEINALGFRYVGVVKTAA